VFKFYFYHVNQFILYDELIRRK